MYDVVGVVCVQYLGDSFWVRWSKEYLLQLQERQKWLKLKKNVAIGDVVLIMDSNLRNSWAWVCPYARINHGGVVVGGRFGGGCLLV